MGVHISKAVCSLEGVSVDMTLNSALIPKRTRNTILKQLRSGVCTYSTPGQIAQALLANAGVPYIRTRSGWFIYRGVEYDKDYLGAVKLAISAIRGYTTQYGTSFYLGTDHKLPQGLEPRNFEWYLSRAGEVIAAFERGDTFTINLSKE